MEFSIAAMIMTMAFVVVSGFVSYTEGTFTSRNVKMGFINHGGMWDDFFGLAILNGLVAPYLKGGYTSAAIGAALIATLAIHAIWEDMLRKTESTCHIFPNYNNLYWWKNVSAAGALHIAYMTLQLAVIIMYLYSPMPKHVVWIVSTLLAFHTTFGSIQPGWYCTRKVWTIGNIAPCTVMIILIGIIGAIKLRYAYSA